MQCLVTLYYAGERANQQISAIKSENLIRISLLVASYSVACPDTIALVSRTSRNFLSLMGVSVLLLMQETNCVSYYQMTGKTCPKPSTCRSSGVIRLVSKKTNKKLPSLAAENINRVRGILTWQGFSGSMSQTGLRQTERALLWR